MLFYKLYFRCHLSVLVCAALFDSVHGDSSIVLETEKQIREVLLEDYDNGVHPGNSSATDVSINLYANALLDITEKSETYTMDAYFRVRWQDPKLAWENLNLSDSFSAPEYLKFPPVDIPQLWLPDLYFSEALEIEPGTGTYFNEEYLRLYPDGRILWTRRLLMKNFCGMDFARLPFDKQSCNLTVETFGETVKTTRLAFYDPGVEGFEILEVSEWVDFKTATEVGTMTYSTGVFPYARIIITMSREHSVYFSEAVYNAILFVFISYCGYWIDPAAAPARIALAIICLLISLSNINSVRSKLPRISYSVWLSNYLEGCMYFNFLAVFSYTAVNYSMQVLKNKNKRKEENTDAKVQESGVGAVQDLPVSSALEVTTASFETQSLGVQGKVSGEVHDEQRDSGSRPAKYRVLGPQLYKQVDELTEAIAPYMQEMDRQLRWLFPIVFFVFTVCMFGIIDTYSSSAVEQ